MKPVSDSLFTFERTGMPADSYERCSAEDLALEEKWFRDAIFKAPELVIGPCRAAGLVEDEEEWYPWQKEFPTDAGRIDVLLISSQGRVAVVETKLAANPESRRKVLAQVLDYLAQLPEALNETMPTIPTQDNEPVAEEDDVREAVAEGNVLVVIASDEVDSRVAKLSRNLLSDHLVKRWDLVLIDLALYRPNEGARDKCFIIPNVRSLVKSEPRQVVRVIVQGENPSATVEVERVTIDEERPASQRWDETQFFENLEAWGAPPPVQDFATKLRELASRFPESVTLAWGRGKKGSMVLKRFGGGLIEVYGSGKIKFRPLKFTRALGDERGREYRIGLEKIIPRAMTMKYPRVAADEAAKVVPAIYELVQEALEGVDHKT